ncbi:MAG TPA: hypothetical protein VJL54_02685 [Nitrososphaera sp.]|nr:hypothetical protein [Nitrososphaera sp.]
MAEPKFKAGKMESSIIFQKKQITIGERSGIPFLTLANEYGNSLTYELSRAQFDSLHEELWRFVKESQH